jgi:hypothetical protein
MSACNALFKELIYELKRVVSLIEVAAPNRASVRSHSSSFTASDSTTDSKAVMSVSARDKSFVLRNLKRSGAAQDVMLAGIDFVVVALYFLVEVILVDAEEFILCIDDERSKSLLLNEEESLNIAL